MKILSLTALLASVALAGYVSAADFTRNDGAAPADIALDNIADRWVAENAIVGVSASCAIDQEIYSAVAGLASASSGSPLTIDHQFQIGSVTKTFTAAAILTLIADGQINLNDPLVEWFPNYPNAADITVHQLLSMTAGTYDIFRATPENPFIPVILQDVRRVWSPDDVIAFAASQPPHSAPGRDYWYSNTNYLLLGKIIERTTGGSLGQFLDETFFGPAGLTSTSLSSDDVTSYPIAGGFLRNWAFLFGLEEPFSSKPNDIAGLASLVWAAGGMTATTADLARWVHMLSTDDIIDKGLLTTMATPTSLSIAADTAYGLGIEKFETPFGEAYGHAGSIPGYASLLVHFPSTQTTVSVATNDEAGEPLLMGLAIEIAGDACGA